ncbi:MAG: hypothetical protein J07HB67_00910 [halophilic archaeon J07HB67]|nr:MAG: hypothetical protein J07HB67_00910 [halophilic archaeon J07HB67]
MSLTDRGAVSLRYERFANQWPSSARLSRWVRERSIPSRSRSALTFPSPAVTDDATTLGWTRSADSPPAVGTVPATGAVASNTANTTTRIRLTADSPPFGG